MGIEIEDRDSIRIIRLGSPDENIVVLNEARLREIQAAVAETGSKESITGLVFIGNSSSSFCAGADVNAIQGVTQLATAEKLSRGGQLIFHAIAELEIPTVAAIGGACVGGGCELALACDYRVLLDNKSTRIGLPEVKLGILPGFGGCQRLPRLIGLPAALDIILKGRLVSARRARSIGLADKVIAVGELDESAQYASLEKAALEIASGSKTPSRKGISLFDKFLSFTSIGRNIVKSKAKQSILKETRGKYPAPLEALRVSADGLGMSLDEGLKEEAKACGRLLISPECKSLVHIYFLTERAKKLGKSATPDVIGAKIAVLGGGVMGAGIAASCLEKGYEVVLSDLSQEAREKAREHIRRHINKKRSIPADEKELILKRLTITGDTSDFAGAGFLIEAIVENLDIKRKVLSGLCEIVSSDCIIASNTSSLSISKIAQELPQPERVVGMHFFNPAEKMPLVEVVRGEKTNDATTARTAALATQIGKFVVVVEDVPGFLVNRILSPYIAEAGALLFEGYSIEDIDKAALDFGMPMGPIRLLDEVGLDVAAKVQEEMVAAYGERMQAPQFLETLIAEGRLGRKSSLGFYRHSQAGSEVDQEVYNLIGADKTRDLESSQLLSQRLVFALINEAVLCFDENVAGLQCPEAAGQVDLATVMGMGFAPFRGGTLKYAESLGAKEVLETLQKLAQNHGVRFEAHQGIKDRAERGSSFYEAAK
jgi:3-hydroxyacyl-CoA dehydrogenase/enoyl-CoA hydratase/3-hydroxybutyryl-CoA epimerase